MARDLSLNVSSPASPEWISGRVETLLSHFFRPTTAEAVEEAAMMDWINALSGYSQAHIDAACNRWIGTQRKRPSPGDIRGLIDQQRRRPSSQGADRSALTHDEAVTLTEKILPTARRWVRENPPGSALHDQGRRTLEHWGESA